MVSGNTEISFAEFCTLHLAQEVFVVGYDDQLKVRLILSTADDFVQ